MKVDFDDFTYQILRPSETEETLFTTAQLVHILLQFAENDVTPEKLDRFIERGLFEDVVEAIGQIDLSYDPKKVSRRTLRQIFNLSRLSPIDKDMEPKGSLPRPKIIYKDYVVRINYDRSLVSMIRSAKPVTVDEDITKKRFPKYNSGIVDEKLRLVSMDDRESDVTDCIGLLDIMSKMDGNGYSPASIQQLLAIVSERSDVAHETFYALGCNDHPDGRVPVWNLAGREGTRKELVLKPKEDHLLRIGALLFVKRQG